MGQSCALTRAEQARRRSIPSGRNGRLDPAPHAVYLHVEQDPRGETQVLAFLPSYQSYKVAYRCFDSINQTVTTLNRSPTGRETTVHPLMFAPCHSAGRCARYSTSAIPQLLRPSVEHAVTGAKHPVTDSCGTRLDGNRSWSPRRADSDFKETKGHEELRCWPHSNRGLTTKTTHPRCHLLSPSATTSSMCT